MLQDLFPTEFAQCILVLCLVLCLQHAVVANNFPTWLVKTAVKEIFTVGYIFCNCSLKILIVDRENTLGMKEKCIR